MNITRAELAKRLQVSASTIVRMLNGDTKVIQKISPESISNALELDEMERRAFLKIASTAGFALATGVATSKAVLRYKIDLDMADGYVESLRRLFDQGGHAHYVLESAQKAYDRLTEEAVLYPKDKRLAATQLHFGLLLGNAQAFILPWDQRAARVFRTYTMVEKDVIRHFELQTFQHDYAILLANRAPFLRELGNFDRSLLNYDLGIHLAKGIDDPSLRAGLFRNRAYIHAIIGDETRWRWELDGARRDALQISATYPEETLALITYTEAEGYKRLAFNPRMELPRRVRLEYAQHALHNFTQALAEMEHRPEVQGSLMRSATELSSRSLTLLTRVSEAQCLVLIDPAEAIRRLEQMRNDVEMYYPALLAKLERTLRIARGQLQAHRSNPLLLFGRDTWGK